MYGVFLTFHDPAGERVMTPIGPGQFLLPGINLTGAIDLNGEEKSAVYIELIPLTETVTVTSFESRCILLGNGNFRLELPVSTVDLQYSVILREGDHILTDVGRWEILCEDEHSSVHNSMRPPAFPPPTIPSDALDPLHSEHDPRRDRRTASSPHSSPTASIGPLPSIEEPNSFASSAAGSITIVDPESSIETQRPPQRSNELLSEHTSEERVRFSPSTHTPSDSATPAEKNERNEDTVTVTLSPIIPPKSAWKYSKKSRRSATASPVASKKPPGSQSPDWNPRVYMAATTTIDQSHPLIMKLFNNLGASVAKTIAAADILCVASDKPLVKSGSLLLALTCSKNIVTEDWIIESAHKGGFLDPDCYLPRDPAREQEWDFSLVDAVASGQNGQMRLLAGMTVYFTQGLRQSVTGKVATDLSMLGTATGAKVKRAGPGRQYLKEAADLSTIIVLGCQADLAISKLGELFVPVYSKDLLTLAALKDTLEFNGCALTPTVKEEQT